MTPRQHRRAFAERVAAGGTIRALGRRRTLADRLAGLWTAGTARWR